MCVWSALVYAYGDQDEADRLWQQLSDQQLQFRDRAYLADVSQMGDPGEGMG